MLADTGEATMTGGRLAAVRKYVEADDLVMCTYGDGVANVDFEELVAFHRSHGKIATVTAVRPPGRFGELSVDSRNGRRVQREAAGHGGPHQRRLLRVRRDAHLGLPRRDPSCVLEAEPMRALVRDRQLAAYEHTGFWQPMDTLREFNLLNELWSSGRAPWKVWP